jgi:hypothetical protein
MEKARSMMDGYVGYVAFRLRLTKHNNIEDLIFFGGTLKQGANCPHEYAAAEVAAVTGQRKSAEVRVGNALSEAACNAGLKPGASKVTSKVTGER